MLSSYQPEWLPRGERADNPLDTSFELDPIGRQFGRLHLESDAEDEEEHPLPDATPPDESDPISFVSDSGTAHLDSLLRGMKWGGGVGTGVTLEFSFADYGSTWATNYGNGEPTDGFEPLNASAKAAVRVALQYWSDLCNITFVEVADTAANVGDLRFGTAEIDPGAGAWAYYPSTNPAGGDVWLNATHFSGDTNFGAGTYNLCAVMHEIGHALGLQHPHTGGATDDWLGTSVMTYRSNPGDDPLDGWGNSFFATTPMLWDIQAIQYLYGVNTTTRSGNDTYSWAADAKLFQSIYDSGGIDTIDWSNQSSAATINLVGGTWSKLGPAYTWYEDGGGSIAETVSIANGVTIENATGGSGNDIITGNTVTNTLIGNLGNDTLDGANGNDRLVGGNGNDRLFGGSGNDTNGGGEGNDLLDGVDGNDTLWGGNGNDTSYGGTGNDLLQADAGNDTLHGEDGNDGLYGQEGNDNAYGRAGIDLIYGGNGNDRLHGDDANDTVWGENGDDFCTGGNGNDSVDGGNGKDSIDGNAGNDSLWGRDSNDTVQGGNGNDLVDGGKGNDFLNGGSGNDSMRGGPGVDTLTGDIGADRFIFDDAESGLGAQRDRILDFKSAEQDRIDLSLIDANASQANDQAFIWKGTGGLTGVGQVRYQVSGGTTILQMSTDSDAQAEIELQLTGGINLQAGWLIL